MPDRRWIANPRWERAALAAVLVCGGMLWTRAFAESPVEQAPVSTWELLSRELQDLPSSPAANASQVAASSSATGEGP